MCGPQLVLVVGTCAKLPARTATDMSSIRRQIASGSWLACILLSQLGKPGDHQRQRSTPFEYAVPASIA